MPRRSIEPSENDIQRAIVDLLVAYGWQVHRLQAGLAVASGKVIKLGEKGQPDLLAIRSRTIEVLDTIEGVMVKTALKLVYDCVYIEVKAPRGRLRSDQELWITEARRRGLAVIVVRSVDDLAAQMAGLAMDGYARHGGYGLFDALQRKHAENTRRQWPVNTDENMPTEHIK